MASRKSVTVDQPKRGKSTGGALTTMSQALIDELQADATEASSNVRSFGESNIVSTKGGLFSYKGENWGDNLRVVVLASANVNEYYEGDFDPSRKGVTPACYAIAAKPINMAPHANAPDKQATVCDGCPQAEMGSARQGKGPACKRKVRVAVLHADDVATADAVSEAVILQIAVPAMSVSNYGAYVKVLAREARFKQFPTYVFETEISLEKHPTYQYVMKFSPVSELASVEVLNAVRARVSESKELVLMPFPPPADQRDDRDNRGGPPKKKALPGKKPEATTGKRSRFG